MLRILISLFIVLILLLIAEVGYRKKLIRANSSRIFLHIVIDCFIAFWPYYMSYKQIEIIAVAFLLVNLISIKFHIFNGIHKVKRRTWGELFYPIGIGFVAMFSPIKLVFTIAMLMVGIADGLAAVVGEKYGKSNTYKLFNQTKSRAGTITFLIAAFVILLVAKIVQPHQIPMLNWFALLYLPIILALSENFGAYGSDDFLIPMMTLVVLSWL